MLVETVEQCLRLAETDERTEAWPDLHHKSVSAVPRQTMCQLVGQVFSVQLTEVNNSTAPLSLSFSSASKNSLSKLRSPVYKWRRTWRYGDPCVIALDVVDGIRRDLPDVGSCSRQWGGRDDLVYERRGGHVAPRMLG